VLDGVDDDDDLSLANGTMAFCQRARFGRWSEHLPFGGIKVRSCSLAPALLQSRLIPVVVEVQMNALDLLTEDHQKVRELFEQVQQIRDNDQKKELFDQIDTELAVHAEIEETIFYPALEKHDALKEFVREAREEHEQVEQLLLEIEDLATEDTDFSSQLAELQETVEHHVAQEEEEMFPKVREIFDKTALEQLGRELASGKQMTPGKDDIKIA
jgi:hemerythrin superfamily protein